MTGILRWNKTKTPAGPDGWNLTPDLGTALDAANVVVPVATQSERDALAPPGGKYAGMVVSRTDLPGAPLERWDGAAWTVTDVPWTTLSTVQGFTPNTTSGWSGIQYAVKDGWVIVNGSVGRGTSWGSDQAIAVIPSALKPACKIQGAGVQVEPTVGNITLDAGSVVASFAITWPLF